MKLNGLIKRNSSTILSILATAGVVVTTVSAVKVTPKALELIRDATDEKGEKLTLTETAVVGIKPYIPTLIFGFGTITCILGANVLNKNVQASISSAYALVNESYKNYRKTLISLHGEEADNEVRDAMARSICDFHMLNLDVPDEKIVFYEPISQRTKIAYEREIMDAEYHLNRNFTMRGYSTLNEWYQMLGMDETEYGNSMGWSMSSGISWVDFTHRIVKNDDGSSYCEMYPVFYPDDDYLEDW